MPLLSAVQTVAVSGAVWKFPRLTVAARADLAPLLGSEDRSEQMVNLYGLLARVIGGVDGLTDADGAPVAWPDDLAARGEVLAALPFDDVNDLMSAFMSRVYGIGSRAGN